MSFYGSFGVGTFGIDMLNVFDMTVEQITEYLNHFKTNYYPRATAQTHFNYLQTLHILFIELGRLPTRREYLLSYKPFCLCPYQVTDDEYARAAFYFIGFGEIETLPCYIFYYYTQYYMIEHRDPSSIEEFTSFVRRVMVADGSEDPNLELFNEPIVRPVEKTKLDEIRSSICTLDEQTCSICQEDIHLQHGVTLECGHSYHSEDKDCCENGTIFTWFKTNRVCPVCRKEII